MEHEKKIKLRIPLQDLPDFSLFPLTVEAALKWAQALPVTNTDAAVQQLSQVLANLNRTRIHPELRQGIMEALLPSLAIAQANLAKRYLNQPLIMPAEAHEMASLSKQLHTMASTAYTIVAIETIEQRESIRDTNPARLTCQALQRALVFVGAQVLQTFQLYRPLEMHGWYTLHQLYALAERQNLADLPVPEPLAGGSTIQSTYLQALLLGCCKPNHLRQSDLTALYQGLRDWSALAALATTPQTTELFLVDLDSDQPPLYSTLYKENPGASCRFIDTTDLIARLHDLKDRTTTDGIKIDRDLRIPASVLDHLIDSLGSMSLRNFNRTTANGELMLCVGLTSTHYHVAGQKTFQQIILGTGYVPGVTERLTDNPFLPPTSKGDIWQKANPREYLRADEGERPAEREPITNLNYPSPGNPMLKGEDSPSADSAGGDYPVFNAKLADASPGGYGLEWSAELPGDVKSGDIVGLKEGENKEWMIAAIRWLSQLENARTLVGLELLSPRAKSVGASIHQKSGEITPPIRVLLLPEIKLVGQPHTLVTPRVGFRERQKVTLGNHVEHCTIQLVRQVAATGSFAQFEYRGIKELSDVLAENEGVEQGADYDSLWSRI